MKRQFSLLPTQFYCSILVFLLVLFLLTNMSFAYQEDRGAVRKKANKRVALVIGNSAYSKGRLKNPVNDARAIAAVLRQSGFSVTLKTDLDKRSFDEVVYDFGRELDTASVGLFYFAGHGMQIDGQNYLLPVDVRIETRSDVRYEAVDGGRILGKMQDAACPLNIVILDACRNNPFSRGFSRGEENQGLAQVQAPSGSVVAYATQPGNVAADGRRNHSPYTAAMLKYISTPGLSIERFFKQVRREVAKETGNRQISWESTSLLGDFSFFGDSSNRVQPEPFVAVTPQPQGLSQTLTDPTTGMEFVLVKGGCYQMGDTFGEGVAWEKPVHEVCVDDFYMGKYEVTQGEWQKIMDSNPSRFKNGDRYPVEKVSWNDITENFLPKLNRSSGKSYRLPTEAEWEYAAREGGKKVRFGNGKDIAVPREINFVGSAEYKKAYSRTGVYRGKTTQVGSFASNSLGLHDMSGNVLEWCSDWYGENYYRSSSRNNPEGPGSGLYRVYRGGSWSDDPRLVRAAYRYFPSSGASSSRLGFRLVHPVP